jgi:hypothetical protein
VGNRTVCPSTERDNMHIGIDPGLTGAIAKVQGGNIEVWDMPTLELRKKRFVNAPMLADLISSIRTPECEVDYPGDYCCTPSPIDACLSTRVEEEDGSSKGEGWISTESS